MAFAISALNSLQFNSLSFGPITFTTVGLAHEITIKNNVKKESIFSSYAVKEGKKSKVVSAKFFPRDDSKKIKILSEYANQYAAAGNKTLIDQLRGGNNYRTGNWQGYRQDLQVIVDLSEIKKIKSISLGCHQDVRSWIFFPKKVDLSLIHI